MSEELGKWVKIGKPTTVGELIDLLSDYADNVDLGFINGPREGLYAKVEDDGSASLGFQPDEGILRFYRDPNNNDDGGSAFPTAGNQDYFPLEGMSLRDYFAGQALAGYCASTVYGSATNDEQVAGWSYGIADAMLKVRKKGKPE